MVNYRRNFLQGGTYFFTLTLKNRQSNLLVEKFDLLQVAMHKVKKQHPFQIKAYVILPEHLHMIWKLPSEDANYSKRWKIIKALYSKSIAKSGLTLMRTKHNEYTLWQRRFWEHTIKDYNDFENHINYIHYNPVKHRLVTNLHDWPYSSFHYYVQKGFLPKNWTVSDLNSNLFGE